MGVWKWVRLRIETKMGEVNISNERIYSYAIRFYTVPCTSVSGFYLVVHCIELNF